jgi:hypothetical protein
MSYSRMNEATVREESRNWVRLGDQLLARYQCPLLRRLVSPFGQFSASSDADGCLLPHMLCLFAPYTNIDETAGMHQKIGFNTVPR